ncbi:tigger transposable element-derived protein 6-like [Gigantopelta aegis]|uniref:tigger transposable element-derived protein 6-like n=1 Tax=Gigantopelta aegis TaxID=1735272 RepID=UPI001B88870D|nr:tigger transposable element-derived protein 6-like [Gigantopelta aegis]
MEGHFDKPLVIGKAAKPRCFRNINVARLQVTWKSNKKAWMTGFLFTEWIKDFDKCMRLSKHKVLLLLDNATSHASTKLTNVKVVFLPANTTSKLQPLDQGIIQAMKMGYRKRLLRSVIARLDSEENVSSADVAKSVSVLDAVQWLKAAVKDVRTETVKRCFAKAGIRSAATPTNEDDDPDDDVHLSKLRELVVMANGRLEIDDHMSVEEYSNMDFDLPVCENLEEDWEDTLVHRINGKESEENVEPSVNDSDDDDKTEGSLITSHQDALKWLREISMFCLTKEIDGVPELMQKAQEELETRAVHVKCSSKQSTIDN